jgi:hypothetical protein
MRKITLFDEFLVLLGPIISRFFACSNEEKINKTTNGARSSPISMSGGHKGLFNKLDRFRATNKVIHCYETALLTKSAGKFDSGVNPTYNLKDCVES